MKGFRLLLLVLAICLASGVKAQFYDGSDDIYYYVEEYYEYEETATRWGPYFILETYKTGNIKKKFPDDENSASVFVFNFDGKTAAELTECSSGQSVRAIKSYLQEKPSYFEDKVETSIYDWKFESSSYSGTVYKASNRYNSKATYTFSPDRKKLVVKEYRDLSLTESYWRAWTYKLVDKSYFKVGRSRTPSTALHE